MLGRALRGAVRIAIVAAAALFLAVIQRLDLQAAEPPIAAAEQTPPPVRELLRLLGDGDVRNWLEKQRRVEAAERQATDAGAPSISQYFGGRAEAARAQIAALADALPDLPAEFAKAWRLLRADVAQRGTPVALLVVLFGGLGAGMECLFVLATARLRRHLGAYPVETVGDRVAVVGGRLALGAGAMTAFAVGSLGAFLVFEWPALLREAVAGYLIAALATRAAMALGQCLLAPRGEQFRVMPIDLSAARFWHRRLTLFVGWFAFGYVTISLLRTVGFSLPGRQLVAYALGIGLLVIAIEAVWRRPAAGMTGDATAAACGARFGATGRNALLSCVIVLLWVLWVVRAMPAFWLLLLLIVLPLACRIAARAVEHLLESPGSPSEAAAAPRVAAVLFERGIRALLIIAAIAMLAWAWGIDFELLTEHDALFMRLLRGGLSAVVVALIADVAWHVAKAAIDRTLSGASDLGQPNTPEARRRARLRTLLPIFRNVLFVVVVTVAAMMVLASLGVEIGPLIAGAGVIGVAIGFGAQAFVRDVIAGMFYLVDDAFRVGEYIQSGNYKGTVESFSIRSVRLRHHRGPVYTVPFSLLGAVQNMSRDWVIDKMLIGITYDSDIERARKLIKQIGQELVKVPEFAPLIIEPLKMQGVERFDDFAVQIRLKMTTVPGEQFVIRRKAFAMIKQSFDANGIKFAFPVVQVAGDASPAAAAAAEQGLELLASKVA